MDPGESSLPPFPEGWKVRPDKQDPHNDTGQIELEPTIEMEELTIEHGGRVRSDPLPEGWMFKQIAESINKDNEWSSTLHNLSDDGMNFKSMKTSLDHMEYLT